MIAFRFNDVEHGKAIAERAGCIFNPLGDAVISATRDGMLLGGVTMEKFTGESIWFHAAGFVPNWLNRDFLWCSFDYMFNQLGVGTVFAGVASDNQLALGLIRKLGFGSPLVLAGAFKDADWIIHRMAANECKWLDIKPRCIVSNLRVLEHGH